MGQRNQALPQNIHSGPKLPGSQARVLLDGQVERNGDGDVGS